MIFLLLVVIPIFMQLILDIRDIKRTDTADYNGSFSKRKTIGIKVFISACVIVAAVCQYYSDKDSGKRDTDTNEKVNRTERMVESKFKRDSTIVFQGTIMDYDQNPIEGAQVTLKNLSTDTVLSDMDGGFLFVGLSAEVGEHVQVTVIHNDYDSYVRSKVIPGPCEIKLKKKDHE